MSREDVAAKARRLVAAGRVHIHRDGETSVVARVDGDTGSHRVVWDRSGVTCWCPARGPCSHIAALRLVSNGPTRREYTMDTPITEPDSAVVDVEVLEEAEANVRDGLDVVEEVTPDPRLLAIAEAPVTYQTLRLISETEFVPGALRGRPDAVLAAVLYGRELGLGPMESLAHVDVIDGRPSPSAELLNRLIREAGHTIEVLEATDTECRLRGTRTDTDESQEVSFTVDDADRAGLLIKPAWKQYPADMLLARCLSRLHRRLFPDVGQTGDPHTRIKSAESGPEPEM